jgi:hypothetical protein
LRGGGGGGGSNGSDTRSSAADATNASATIATKTSASASSTDDKSRSTSGSGNLSNRQKVLGNRGSAESTDSEVRTEANFRGGDVALATAADGAVAPVLRVLAIDKGIIAKRVLDLGGITHAQLDFTSVSDVPTTLVTNRRTRTDLLALGRQPHAQLPRATGRIIARNA